MDIGHDVLKKIVEESLNPIACVKCVDVEDTRGLTFVYVNESFAKIYGDSVNSLLNNPIKISDMIELNQNDPLSTVLLDVYNSENPVYKLIDVPYLGKTFNVKGFFASDDLICLVLADVTEFENAKREAQEMCMVATSAKEQLKYQVDLLTAKQNQLEATTRIHQLVAKSINGLFYYKNYETLHFFATELWYDLFTVDGNRPLDAKNIVNAISDEDVFEYSRWRERTIAEGKSDLICEFRLSDEKTWVEASYHFVYDDNKKLCEEIALFKDITTIKAQKEELAYKAYYDEHTGLINRTYMTKLIDNDVRRAKEEDVSINILYIDIDNFKQINDTIGYKMADEFIYKFSMILKEYESATTKVARFDSDEFVISIYDGSRYAAMDIAKDIRKKLSSPMVLSNGLTQNLTVSIGINQYPEGGRKALDLISNADIALHKVKESGKNGVLVFNEEMLDEFLKKIEMENTIKRALEQDKFVLYYQPQYQVDNKKLRGVEALIRLKDEVLGFVSPASFIPLAEKNGSIVEIGEWVIRRAFEDYNAWREAYEFDGVISLNISTIQFKQVTFESTLYSLIKEYKMDPSKVEIEITESVFADNTFLLSEMIKRIRNNGIKVSLDDFGTGYSSLSYLKNIPIDTLKIDKSFIDSIGELKSSDIITSSLIDMVKKLGLEIIAEGVETQEQFEFLSELHCDNVQGFYLAKPMDADSLRKIIREEKC